MNRRHVLFGISILVGVWLTQLGLAQCHPYCKVVREVAFLRAGQTQKCRLLVDGSAMLWSFPIWNPDGDALANFVRAGTTVYYDRCGTCNPKCEPIPDQYPQEAEVGGCRQTEKKITRWICDPPPSG